MKETKPQTTLLDLVVANTHKGCWPAGYLFAAQDGDGEVYLYKVKPTRRRYLYRCIGFLSNALLLCESKAIPN